MISLFVVLLVDKEKCPGAIEIQAENKIRRNKDENPHILK